MITNSIGDSTLFESDRPESERGGGRTSGLSFSHTGLPEPDPQSVSESDLGQSERPSLCEPVRDVMSLLQKQHADIMAALMHQDEKLRLVLEAIATEPSEDEIGALLKGPDSERNIRSPFSPGASAAPQLFHSYSTTELRLKADAAEAHEMAVYKSTDPTQHVEPPPRPSCLKRLATSPAFDGFFAAVVLSNAIFIGVEVQVEVSYPTNESNTLLGFHFAFTILFATELIIRWLAAGCSIFWAEDWMWTWLDMFIVLSSTWELAVEVFQGELEGLVGVSSLKALRIIRLTRIFKTAQVMRIFRFVIALRTLVRSIVHTLKALIWALLLLSLIVYVFAVLFTQTVNTYILEVGREHLELVEELKDSERYFGSLQVTMLSLFMSIAGGVSWEAVITPLTFISPVWAGLFLFYISFTYFAVLNVVTGVFCQSAIESSQNDHLTVAQSLNDNNEAHVTRLRTIFAELGACNSDGITFHAFEEKMHDPAVKEYFETLGINVYDAWSFFKLLDEDGGGSVEPEEFFKGCLRFRGQARAIEVGKLLHDQQWLIRSTSKFQSFVEEEIMGVKQQMGALVDVLTMSSHKLGRSKSRDPPKHLDL